MGRWLIAGAVYVFLHLPVLVLVVFSFNASRYSVSWTGFTLDWYRAARRPRRPLRGLRASLIVGIVSTRRRDGVSAPCWRWHSARGRFRGRRALEGLLYSADRDAGDHGRDLPAGAVRAGSGLPLGLGTITIAHIAFNIAFVAVVVRARLAGMDRSLEEAALMLGADELTAFRTVTVPPALARHRWRARCWRSRCRSTTM